MLLRAVQEAESTFRGLLVPFLMLARTTDNRSVADAAAVSRVKISARECRIFFSCSPIIDSRQLQLMKTLSPFRSNQAIVITVQQN